MKKIYCICGQLVANEIVKNEHILSHFKQKHCIGCDKQLIFVAGKWYQPHVDIICNGFKQEPEYDNSEIIDSCDPCSLLPVKCIEPMPSIEKIEDEVLIGADPLDHIIPESIEFENEFLEASDESMAFNEAASESSDETQRLTESLSKSYPCKVCPISFMRKHNHYAHMKKYHPTYTEDSKEEQRAHKPKSKPVKKRDRSAESSYSSHRESFEETNDLLEEAKHAMDGNEYFPTNQVDSIESPKNHQSSITSSLKPNRGPKLRLFGCPLCSIRFTRRSNAARHIKQYHHDNENAQNGNCMPIESTSNQERDSRVRNFKCSLCTLRFVYRRNLNRHIRETHHNKNTDENVESNAAESPSNQCGDPKGKQFGCSLCPIRFTHISSAKRHLRQFHGGDGGVISLSDSQNDESKPTELLSNPVATHKDHQSSYENKPFGCPLCPFRFTRRGNVNRHIRQCHREESNDLLNIEDPAESSSNQDRDSKEKQFGCPLCSSRFIQRSSAVRHMRDIHGEEDYSLNDSSPALTSFDHFKENPYGCAICESRFKHRQDLIEHKRIVHQIMSSAYKKKRPKTDRKFICDLCGKIFQIRHTFKLHMDMHMDRRPFSCELCGKTFRRSMSLSEHRHSHTGTKPFKCNVDPCDGAFVRRTELFRHQFKKHGILRKKIQCSLCDQVFPENSLLRKHLKNHT